MIKFMVIKVGQNLMDIWTEIVAYDLPDHKTAQSIRETYLEDNIVDPDNVTVVQYKE